MRLVWLEWQALRMRARARRKGLAMGLVGGLALTLAAGWAGAGGAGAASVRVLPGQNLTQLARSYGTSVAALAAANGIADPNHVVAGSVLVVPAGPGPASTGSSTVVVARGDTLSGISARYGTSVAALAQANGIADPNHVLVGSRLVVPSPSTPGSTLPAGTQLASYSIPTSAAPAGLPATLLAHPDRVALRPVFDRWASQLGIPANLLEAMCWWESGWQSDVVSVTSAEGIGQLEPSTVAAMRRQLGNPTLDPLVASDNIEMAAAFLHDLLVETHGDQQLALAGYYQGLTSVQRAGLFPSTTQYVQGITAYLPYFA